jgi:CRISPR/Cas system-associated endonuclease Cas1
VGEAVLDLVGGERMLERASRSATRRIWSALKLLTPTRLTEDARKRVLITWQERKRDELRHPFLGETTPLGLVAHLQAQLLARHLRGDLDGYPGFIWK